MTELTEIPVKAQSLVVILLHFDEARLDVNLRGNFIQGFNRPFNGVQILLGGFHKKFAEPVVKENRFAGRLFEVNPKGGEK